MAKPRVEKAPEFDLATVDMDRVHPYLAQYKATDEQGRYLHWSQLKWRVPTVQATDIWSAIKLQRSLQMKFIALLDDKQHAFCYCTPHAMEAKLHEIVRLAGGSLAALDDSLAPESIQRKFLVSSLVMEEAITSAQLEGAATTREVAKKMLEDEREPLNEDEQMILNNYLLLLHAERCHHEPLTVDMILEFHRIATQGTSENCVVPGEFRQDNAIYVDDGSGEMAYQPPCYTQIPQRLLLLCEFANQDHSGKAGSEFIAPVVKAIILHFMLGYEHPFRDGNGRTARALFYWFMLKSGYELFKYISISKLLKDDPKGYGLSYLYTEKDHNDLTYFIDYQLDTIHKAFAELVTYLQAKTDEFQQVVVMLQNSAYADVLNFVQKDLIKKGSKEPGRVFTVKEVANSYSLSVSTARTYLQALLKHRLFLSTKEGKTVLYIAPADLKQRLGSEH